VLILDVKRLVWIESLLVKASQESNRVKINRMTEMELRAPAWSNWRYSSPMTQIVVLGLVCFCCPGMFNAINGLGAVGKTGGDTQVTDNANTALSVTFATCSLLAGGLFNIFGHQVLLFLGGLTYVLYIGSYLSTSGVFTITAGAILGIGAGFLWAAQGAMMISYPDENKKGKFIGVFWSIFNLGGALGSLIPLVIEWNSKKSTVSTATYSAFMTIMGFGAVLSLALLPPGRVFREGGEAVSIHKYSNVREETVQIFKLFGDWKMLALAPMFIASNWFYTYQFNCFNGGGLFSTRARAFNGTFYWSAQIVGSNLMGKVLDCRFISKSRRLRAQVGLAALLVFSTAIWAWGYEYQTRKSVGFTRSGVLALTEDQKLDLRDGGRYAEPMILYTCYGFFDAVWQTYCYWIMGALTNDTRKAARYSGFYKAVQNAGTAGAAQLDAKKLSFTTELIVNWALLSYGCLSAAFVTFFAVKESNELLDVPPATPPMYSASSELKTSSPQQISAKPTNGTEQTTEAASNGHYK
jgi:MFS family permease